MCKLFMWDAWRKTKKKVCWSAIDWEGLPKAGWHLKAGCSLGILLFFDHSPTWASYEICGLYMIFKCFSLFLTMQTHAQACVHWSKYTTDVTLTNNITMGIWVIDQVRYSGSVRVWGIPIQDMRSGPLTWTSNQAQAIVLNLQSRDWGCSGGFARFLVVFF